MHVCTILFLGVPGYIGKAGPVQIQRHDVSMMKTSPRLWPCCLISPTRVRSLGSICPLALRNYGAVVHAQEVTCRETALWP